MHPRSTVALSLIAVALAGLLVLAGEAQAATQKAKVTRLVGDVTHRVGAQGQWVQSRAGSLLPGGSRLRTGPGGRAEIAFPDGTVFRMGQRSDLVIQAATQAKVSRGQIYARIIAGTAMKVSGATATAAVRGTTLSLEVAEDGTTVLTVATGEVDFYNDLGSVVVAESQQSTARPGEAPTRPIVIDPSSLQAWEASLDGLIIELEQPPHVETDPERLQQQLPQRRDAVEQQPEDASTHADLSRVLLDLGRSEEAVAEAERAVELAPEAAEYQGLMGYALLQAGRLDQAEGAFEEAARGEPGNVRWVIGRALVALGRNDDEAAADVLQRAAEMAPDDPLPYAYLAAAELRLGDLAAADEAASRAADLGPQNHLAQSYLAYVRLVQGRLGEAADAASAAVAAAPASALAHDALGTAYFFAGDFEQARQQLERALELNPVSARAHLTLAKLTAAEGEIEEALNQARAASSLNPNSAPAHSTYGLLLMLNNDPQAADEQFQQALALDPNLAEAHTGWGRVMARRGAFREALDQQKAALALDTGSAAVQNNLGGLYASDGRMSLAIEHLQRAIELQPGWGLPYANLAFVHLELNEHDRALEMGERAVELGERSPFVHTVLARIYMRQGRTDRALTELRQAVALDEDYPQAHYQLAQLYLQSDRARDAVREILTALTKDPSAMLETRRYARTETTGWIGSHEELHLDARHSGMAEEGRLSYFASGVTEDSDGFRAVNHDHSEGLVEVIAGHQPDPDHQLAFYGTWFDTDAALPGPRTEDRPGDPDDRHALSGWDALVAYRSKLSPAASATVKYTVRTSQFRFRNPGSLQVADDNPFRMLENEQTQHMPEVRVEADLQDGTRLSAGYAHQWTDRDRSGEVGAVDPESGEPVFEPFATSTSPETSNFWIEARRDVSEDLSVLIGGRYGKQSGADGVSRPRFVALYRPDRSSWLSLTADPIFRTDIAELAPVEPLADPFGLRYLSFTEGGSGQSYQLRYQRSAAAGGTLTGALAYQDVDGLMIDTQDPAFTGLPGRVLVEEGERWVADVGYEQWLNDAVTGRVWVRWQDSEGSFPEVQVTGTEWPYVPQWQLGGRLDYIDREGWRVGLEGVWVDDRFHDAQNTQAVSGYGLLNLRAQYQRSLHENYFVEILNLTDKGYETFWGFPQSGLAVRAGVQYRH